MAYSDKVVIIIPPSIPMVIFGVAAMGLQIPPAAVARHGEFASLSIPKLFMAGAVPGLVMALALILVNYLISRRRGYRGLTDTWSGRAIVEALRHGVWSRACFAVYAWETPSDIIYI